MMTHGGCAVISQEMPFGRFCFLRKEDPYANHDQEEDNHDGKVEGMKSEDS